MTKYVKVGKIRVITKPNGFYDYNEDDVYSLAGYSTRRLTVAYSRVSTNKQKKYLENQEKSIVSYCNNNGIRVDKSYKDIASGMNFDRKQFLEMFNDIIDRKIQTVYITYKDRLSRISFDLFEKLFREYRKRGSEFNMYYTNQNCKIKDGKIVLSKELSIDIPQYEKYSDLLENFKQIRILPNHIGYRIEVIYEVEDVEIPKRKEEKIASIDLGIDNLATIVSEDFTIIFSGKFVKSHNQLFNKTLAKLNSIKDLQKIKGTTKRIKKLYYDREQYIEDVFHKISRKIVDLLIDSKITKLVVGYNKGWKTGVNMGKKNNQKFTQIPFARLVSYLEYKCELAGIEIVIHEESYTSKCDFLAFEKIGKHENYLGKRKNRGLFQSSVGKLINADVNGALNIMRKVVGDSCESIRRIIDRGLLFNPVRITNVFC